MQLGSNLCCKTDSAKVSAVQTHLSPAPLLWDNLSLSDYQKRLFSMLQLSLRRFCISAVCQPATNPAQRPANNKLHPAFKDMHTIKLKSVYLQNMLPTGLSNMLQTGLSNATSCLTISNWNATIVKWMHSASLPVCRVTSWCCGAVRWAC